MKKSCSRGFTLIELLTVVAIIAILAALTFTVGPRMIERAKMRRMDSALRQVSMALTAYYIDYQSYPPAYGYVGFEQADDLAGPADASKEPEYYNLMPYMARLRYHGNEEMYDEFSTSYDTDNDGQIGLLEFSPVGFKKPDGTYELDSTLPRYTGQVTDVFGEEINRQLSATRRPFIYIPVNKLQFSKAQKYWLDNGSEYADIWDSSDPVLSRLTFPPRTYDAFVLIGVGPSGNTFGVVPEPLGWDVETDNNGRDLYHILGLRAYYLATRDLDGNGQLDFDFRARTQQNEGAQTYQFAGRTITNNLPSPTMPAGAGPIIYVSQ